MAYNFDRVIDRRGTGSEKWQPFEDGDVLPMPVADMDFASPPELIEALRERVDHELFGYSQPTQSLVDTVTGMCRERYGWEVDPEWIVWLPGLVCGINVTCRAIGSPGDAVMTAVPVYPPFLTAPRNMKRELITVPLRRDGESRWRVDWEAIEKACTPNVRLFLLCQPHNPVGRVFDRGEIERLGQFCLERGIVLCSDEIHCDLILDDIPHTPTAALGPEIARNTITLMAPSKTFNVPGLGCAFAIIPNPKLRASFHQAKAGIVPQVGVFGYAGCEAAYGRGEPWRRELIDYLRGNRDYLISFVEKNLPGVHVSPIQATYLAWFDVRELSLAVFLFKEMELVSYDPNFAAVIGLKTESLRYVLMVLLAFTVVSGIQAVGVVLTSALLITPAAAASLLTDRLPKMMALSSLFAVLGGVIGLYVSYYFPVSSGASIVLACTAIFGVAYAFRALRRRAA